MLVLNACFHWLLDPFAAFMVTHLKTILLAFFFGIVHPYACKCGTRVASLSHKVIQSVQTVCTRLGSTLGV